MPVTNWAGGGQVVGRAGPLQIPSSTLLVHRVLVSCAHMDESAQCMTDGAPTQTSDDVPRHDQIASLLHVRIPTSKNVCLSATRSLSMMLGQE